MKHIFTAVIMASVILAFGGKADCCSAFAVKNKQGQQVAKNFDWVMGDGLVVVNPRGAKRVQTQQVGSGAISWVSKYGSVSFTTFAPGFPISGMNEKGLVVESLHQLDFRQRLRAGNGLMSLEWVQYVLDNFQSTDQVKRFAAQNGFGQVIIPVHFFISDAAGRSIVVHGQGNDIKVTSGKQLPLPVLANRTYSKDLTRFRRSQESSWLKKLFSKNRNSGRFGVVASALNRQTLHSESAIFKLLQSARIPGLTKWQIVWNQTHKTVTWRFFDGQRPQRQARIAFNQFNFSCGAQPLVSSTHSREGVQFAPYSSVDRTLATVRLQAIENALDAALPDAFALAFAKPTQCQ